MKISDIAIGDYIITREDWHTHLITGIAVIPRYQVQKINSVTFGFGNNWGQRGKLRKDDIIAVYRYGKVTELEIE